MSQLTSSVHVACEIGEKKCVYCPQMIEDLRVHLLGGGSAEAVDAIIVRSSYATGSTPDALLSTFLPHTANLRHHGAFPSPDKFPVY